jgi:hypothetical protein
MIMKFDLIVGEKYIVKSGLPFYYEGRSFDNSRYFACSSFYNKGVLHIREITLLSPLFAKITFEKVRRFQLIEDFEGFDRYEEFSFPYFVVYDDSMLEIPDEIQSTIAAHYGKGTATFIKYSRFIDSIVLFEPVLNDRIAHSETMIKNAENVKSRQLQKIDRIFSEYVHEKKSFNAYDDKLKNLFSDLDMIQEKLNTDLPNKPDGGLSEKKNEQA